MNAPGAARLSMASRAEQPLLERLLELYCHDLSEIFELDVNAEGLYGYPRLALYFEGAERRFPFLLHSGAALAGFALLKQGSPICDDPRCMDMAEFFVLRRHRRSGLGLAAARQLFARYPGPWSVRVARRNAEGCAFWSRAIEAPGARAHRRQEQLVDGRLWVHHLFNSAPAGGTSA